MERKANRDDMTRAAVVCRRPAIGGHACKVCGARPATHLVPGGGAFCVIHCPSCSGSLTLPISPPKFAAA